MICGGSSSDLSALQPRSPSGSVRAREADVFRITCSFAIAAALAAGGLVLAIAGVAGATPAASLLQAVAWNRPGAPGLIGDPLSVLSRPPGAGLDVEWAPLYRGTGGERLEQGREVLHANGRRGAWSGA